MEPWDGPASVSFTDGTVIGAVLDRNGLRPSRILGHRATAWSVLASEAGVLDLDPATVVTEGAAAARPDVPGRHRRRAASSTTRRSRVELAAEHPYDEWLHAGLFHLDDVPQREHVVHMPRHRSPGASRAFGYTRRSCAC